MVRSRERSDVAGGAVQRQDSVPLTARLCSEPPQATAECIHFGIVLQVMELPPCR